MATRWHWGHSIALVYGLFAVSTIGFVVFAMEQRVDLVSTDYYEKSIALDARRAAEANARALGDGFRITPAADGSEVTVQWTGTSLQGATGTLTLYRPSDAAADRVTPMAPDGAGRQALSLAGLNAGKWMVQVEWIAGGTAYYAEREVDVR